MATSFLEVFSRISQQIFWKIIQTEHHVTLQNCAKFAGKLSAAKFIVIDCNYSSGGSVCSQSFALFSIWLTESWLLLLLLLVLATAICAVCENFPVFSLRFLRFLLQPSHWLCKLRQRKMAKEEEKKNWNRSSSSWNCATRERNVSYAYS